VRPVGLGFGLFFLIFGTLVPTTITHPKLVELVRNKQNMYGSWCKAHFIPEKLMVKMGNNGRQQLTGINIYNIKGILLDHNKLIKSLQCEYYF